MYDKDVIDDAAAELNAADALDFIATDHGSIIMLAPQSQAADDWLADNIGDDALYMGDALAVEPRYFGDIAAGIIADGLSANFAVTPA